MIAEVGIYKKRATLDRESKATLETSYLLQRKIEFTFSSAFFPGRGGRCDGQRQRKN